MRTEVQYWVIFETRWWEFVVNAFGYVTKDYFYAMSLFQLIVEWQRVLDKF